MIEFFTKKIGARNIPLAYVIRPSVVPDVNPTPLLDNRPFTAETLTVANELVERATHDHPVYADDNATVHGYLEDAYVGTHVHPTWNRSQGQKMVGVHG